MSRKYPRLWALRGAHSMTFNRWYKFGALNSIRTVAPSFQEISELPDWAKNSKATEPATKKSEALKVWSHAEDWRKQVALRRKKALTQSPTALTTNGPAHFTEKEDGDGSQTFPIKGAQNLHTSFSFFFSIVL
ncbi:hypothetical protein ACS0TY_001624 [Phlomoides rotata]